MGLQPMMPVNRTRDAHVLKEKSVSVTLPPAFRLIWYGISATLILAPGLAPQSASSASQNAPAETSLCDSLDSNMPHSDALSNVWQYEDFYLLHNLR